jgi:predicted phage tail protein
VDLSFGSLLLALVIGSIGFGLFLYGRKQGRVPQVVVGIVLIAYPYFVPNPWIAAAIAGAALGLLWGLTRLGW